MKSLRYYQEEAHIALEQDIQDGVKSMLLQMATGTGKTYTTTSFIQNKNFKNVLWLTHKEELIDQSALSLILSCTEDSLHLEIEALYKRFDKSFVELMKFIDKSTPMSMSMDKHCNSIKWIEDNVGLIKQKINQTDKKFVVASIQTAARRLELLSNTSWDAIIIDEAHLALSKTWVSVCQATPHDLLIGLTATPERTDGLAMDNLFSKISYVYDLRQGISDGFLCQIEAVRVKTQIDLNSVRTTAGELNSKDLSIVDCAERNNLICDEWLDRAGHRKTLVFCVNIQHAVNLTQVMKNRGIRADIIVSDKEICPDRRGAIRGLIEGDTEILVNVDILTTGFDHPMLGCIVVARPTKSKNLYIQMVGRGTRLKLIGDYVETFGQQFLLLDIVDITSRHALINSYSLDHGKRLEDRVFLTDERMEELIGKRDRDEAAIQSKIDRMTIDTISIDLLQLPEIDVKELYNMEHQEPTEKQIAMLETLGYNTRQVAFTKASAFTAIGNQEAKLGERASLKRMGYDITLGATHYQYTQAMSIKAQAFTKSITKTKIARKNAQ